MPESDGLTPLNQLMGTASNQTMNGKMTIAFIVKRS